MTTLASKASAETATAHQSPPAQTARAQDDAGTARTVASRFIILLLCLAVVFSTLAFGTVHSWSLAIFYMSAALVAVCWVADAWRTRRLRFSRNLLQLPLVGLVLVGFVQLLPLGNAEAEGASILRLVTTHTLSLDPYATRFVLVELLPILVYFAAALTFIDSPKRLRLVVRTIIIFGCALAILSLMLSVIAPNRVFGVREMRQAQGFGPFINRHHFAGYMELALALPLGLLFAGAVERERRLLYIFAAAIMGIALVLTNSRGGMIALVAEIMFVVLMSGVAGRRSSGSGSRDAEEDEGRGARLRRLALRAALGFALVVALFVGVVLFGGEDALNRLVGTVNSEDPTTGRLHFWRGALEIIRDHPLLGVGLGAFGVAYSRYDLGNGKLFRLEQAHNDYLQVLSDAGVVGALLGLFFVVMLFRTGLRRMQSNSSFRRGVALGALTGCFAVLVHSFFDFTLHTTANALLFLLLAAFATLNGRVEHTHRRRARRRSSTSAVREATPTPALETADAATTPPAVES